MTTNHNVTIDPDLYAAVKAEAEKEDRTIAKQLNRILRSALAEKETDQPSPASGW